ncbi:MAG: hypothetical protein ABIG87_00325 [Patescibacteria group bacterium]
MKDIEKNKKNIGFFNIYRLICGLVVLFSFLPMATNAASAPSDFKGVVIIFAEILYAILPVIVLLTFLYFLWGLAQYLRNAGENKEEAKQVMLYGVISFFVMSSVWGLIGMLSTTFGTNTQVPTDFLLTGIDKEIKNLLQTQQQELLEGIKEQQKLLEDIKKETDSLDSIRQDLVTPKSRTQTSKSADNSGMPWIIEGSFTGGAVQKTQNSEYQWYNPQGWSWPEFNWR